MDIRGIEITNQLRSAIRAKLLELGVRYDEELPDYILVMVVNKKTRQQMNEDLNLFLEDNTETFVTWLHDQVLKKLQKVTVAKKKSGNGKDSGPLLPVKKEEDQKKIKEEGKSSSITAPDSQPEVLTKQERDREFEELVGDLALLNEEDSKSSYKEADEGGDKLEKRRSSLSSFDLESIASNSEKSNTLSSSVVVPHSSSSEKKATSPKQSPSETPPPKSSDSTSHGAKRKSNADESSQEKSEPGAKRSKITYDSKSESNDRLKSAVTKPRITSVVSVKNRLGIVVSPTKKSGSQVKAGNERSNSSKNHSEVRRSEIVSHKSNLDQSKEKDRRRQSHGDSRTASGRDSRSKNDKPSKVIGDLREKVNSKSGTIKSRLGIVTNSSPKSDKFLLKPSSSTKVSKPKVSNVRSRLGVKVKPQGKSLLSGATRLSQLIKESCAFQDEEEDDAESVIHTSLKSHIIAIQKPKLPKTKEKTSKVIKKKVGLGKSTSEVEQIEEIMEEEGEEDIEQSKVPSKIIVTPRPLKPLQPFQKRATQSLLLRAVQEANQSVVMQKKIDPCLKEQKPASKIKITRDPKEGKVLAINLNSKQQQEQPIPDRIQIELANRKRKKPKKSHFSQDVTDKDLDVVKSLFARSDNKQKFLVTLNGYNNNVLKELNSDDEEQFEMEVNEGDDFENQYEIYDENDQIIEYIDEDQEFEEDDDNNVIEEIIYEEDDENNDLNEIHAESRNYGEHEIESSKNTTADNLRCEESTSNKRKKTHSPIVYTRSRSNSPTNKPNVASTVNSVLNVDKRPLISSVITTVADKSSEKCRYWPNCTLGIKCAFYHPDVPCSSFPACKFGDKCAYKHPKCKFGSACTKLGCIFSHPPLQCKYHPYCMKPGCPFSHPKTTSSSLSPLSPLPDTSNVRAKFKWIKTN